jgi:hypothetical protein
MQNEALFSLIAARLAASTPTRSGRKAAGSLVTPLDPAFNCLFECICPWDPPPCHQPGVGIDAAAHDDAESVSLRP